MMVASKSCCAIIYNCFLVISFKCISIRASGSTRHDLDLIGRNYGAFKDSVDIGIDDKHKRRLIGEYENCWVQIGDDIDGGREYDGVGSSVDISTVIVNGIMTNATLAVGAYGHATIYNYAFSDGNIYEGEWTRLGERIVGHDPFDEFGNSISLSSNGRIVAVGAPFHKINGTFVGHVRIFGYDSDSGNAASWTQLGQNISGYTGTEQFGNTLQLSGNGHTVIIGTNYGGLNAPITRIFRYSETERIWNLLGSEIVGNAFEKSDKSTSISHDGSIVAIGSPFGSVTRVFELITSDDSTLAGNWTQIGNNIVGETNTDRSGSSVSLSLNGTIVAIGADRNYGSKGRFSGHVRVYSYSKETDQWDQLGQDIDGESPSDQSGSSVSLSDDGLTIAIGAWSNDGNGKNAGHVRMYRFESDEWNAYSQDIDGANTGDNAGGSISLSPEGRMVAIGSRSHAGYAGHVRVFADMNGGCTVTSPPSLRPTSSPSASPSTVASQRPSLSQHPSYFPSVSRNPVKSPVESSVSITESPTAIYRIIIRGNDAPAKNIFSSVVFPFVVGATLMLM